jgi:hypothetical protein
MPFIMCNPSKQLSTCHRPSHSCLLLPIRLIHVMETSHTDQSGAPLSAADHQLAVVSHFACYARVLLFSTALTCWKYGCA